MPASIFHIFIHGDSTFEKVTQSQPIIYTLRACIYDNPLTYRRNNRNANRIKIEHGSPRNKRASSG